MPEHNPGQMGGTMRLGKRRTLFQTKNSVMSKRCLPGPPAAGTSRTHVWGCCWATKGQAEASWVFSLGEFFSSPSYSIAEEAAWLLAHGWCGQGPGGLGCGRAGRGQ